MTEIDTLTRRLVEKGYIIPRGGKGVTPHWSIPRKGAKISPLPTGERVKPSAPKGEMERAKG